MSNHTNHTMNPITTPPPAIPRAPQTAEQVLEAARTRFGFLSERDLATLAQSPAHRLAQVIVRCNQCRFIAPADQTAHIIKALEAAGDYVRDVSLYQSTR